MRVHLRGVVIGVGVLLSVVVVVSIFNALDAPPDSGRPRSRHALSAEIEDEDEEDQGASSSRSSPRSSTRLGPGGPRSARAGGPGARPGGPGARPGGPGARPGGPGARPGGPGARPGAAGARAVGGPRARAGGPGGPGARAAGGRAGGRARPPPEDNDYADIKFGDEDEEDEDFEEPAPRGRAGGRAAGGAAARTGARGGAAGARGRAQAGDDEEPVPRGKAKAPKRTRAKKNEEDEEEDEDEEKSPKKHKKKEPPYPDWWRLAFPKSQAVNSSEEFASDQPLFPECPTFDGGTGGAKIKRFGPVEPANYMLNSKNPCWFEWTGKKSILKCLPYFYIIGAPKSGAADLFSRLIGHPNVMAGGSSAYHWWDRLRYGASKSLKYTKETKRGDDPVGLKEYTKTLVGNHAKNITKELLYGGKSESIFGDASPTYLTDNTQWDVFEGNEGCSEPRIITASFIRHIYPDARIIVMLRNPVERLYSRFLAQIPYVEEFENHTASLFHTFTVQAVNNYRACFSATSIRHCAYNATLFSNAVIRLSEGMYSVFVEDWLRVFPKEQVLILKFEEYVQDVKGHILKVFNHLGVDPPDDVNMMKLAEQPVIRRGKTREEEGHLLPETATLLKEFYTPFNLRLADVLEDEKWLFDKDEVQTVWVPPPPQNVDTEEEFIEAVGPAAPPAEVNPEPEVVNPEPEVVKPEPEVDLAAVKAAVENDEIPESVNVEELMEGGTGDA